MKATYYSAINSPCSLNVVEGRAAKDGLVDLMDDSGAIIVTDCPVSDSPKAGHAVVAKAEKPAKK